MDLLSDTNLNKLETIIQSVCPMLKEKINEFKALQGERPKINADSEALSDGFFQNSTARPESRLEQEGKKQE